MTGQCAGNITVEIPCTPNWQCRQPNDGYEIDGCGNSRLNSQCNPYREAVITGCAVTSQTPITPGSLFTITVQANSGNVTEQYKLVLSGDINATSSPFYLAGTSTVTNVSANTSFTMSPTATGGAKSYTASLVKV